MMSIEQSETLQSVPKDQLCHLHPWDPNTHVVAKEMLQKIRRLAPNLDVTFTGSAALRILGKNDVDLTATCNT